MINFFTNLGTSYILGLLTPLTAVCVLPLFPGFLTYLSNSFGIKAGKKEIVLSSILMFIGITSFMLLVGFLFTKILQVSLTGVIELVSPIAFGILFVVSLALIFNVNLGAYIPKMKFKTSKNPMLKAYLYGFFFGAIVLPCNPAFIIAIFAKAAVNVNTLSNIIDFIIFGLGMSTPLILFALISAAASKKVIGFITKHNRKINFISGVIMLVISFYYLFFVFKII